MGEGWEDGPLDVPVDPGSPVAEDVAVTSITAEGATVEAPVRVITFDLYVDDELVDHDSLAETEPAGSADIAERQNALAQAAANDGKEYTMVVGFWDGKLVRWGRVDGEVVPVEEGVKQLAAELDERFRPKGPCDATKMGYVCMRGAWHNPPKLHAQLVSVIDESSMRVAIWEDDKGRVRLTKISRESPGGKAFEQFVQAPEEANA